MFFNHLVKDLEHKIGAIFKILYFTIKVVREIVQIFFLEALEELQELTQHLLIHNLFIDDQYLTGISVKQLLEKVGNLNFQTLFSVVNFDYQIHPYPTVPGVLPIVNLKTRNACKAFGY